VPSQDALLAAQNYLKAVGIDAQMEVMDFGKWNDMELKGWQNGLFAYGMGPEMNWNFILARFYSASSASPRLASMERPAGLQSMIDQALVIPDFDAGKAAVQNVVKTIHDNAMVVPLYAAKNVVAQQPNVRDSGFYSTGHVALWNPGKAWLSK
jgi:ABC-type transport system substrate-binding protein